MKNEDYDYCFECTAFDDNYIEDDYGNLICRCSECPFNIFIEEN